MEEKNKIGEFLAELRNEKGYTQEKLANKIHVTNKAISNWENGRSKPDLDMMKTLAKFFDVTVDELYAGKRFDEKEALLKRKIKKLFIRTGITIFILNFLLLLIYFFLTIDSVKFYVLDIDDDSINTPGGYYIVNKNKSILHLEFSDFLESNTYIELYEKVGNENKILYSGFYSEIDLYNKTISNLDEVYLKVIETKDGETNGNIYKIKFQAKYDEHRFMNMNVESSPDYTNESENNSELIDKLLELDFLKQDDYLYFREENNKKEKVTTYVDVNIYTYNKVVESKDTKEFITYYQDSDALDVQFINSKNNIYKEFRFWINKELLDCKIGRCNNTTDINDIEEDIEIVKLFK